MHTLQNIKNGLIFLNHDGCSKILKKYIIHTLNNATFEKYSETLIGGSDGKLIHYLGISFPKYRKEKINHFGEGKCK